MTKKRKTVRAWRSEGKITFSPRSQDINGLPVYLPIFFVANEQNQGEIFRKLEDALRSVRFDLPLNQNVPPDKDKSIPNAFGFKNHSEMDRKLKCIWISESVDGVEIKPSFIMKSGSGFYRVSMYGKRIIASLDPEIVSQAIFCSFSDSE